VNVQVFVPFFFNNFGPQCRKPSKYQPLANYSMGLSENHPTKKKHAFIVSKLPFDDHQMISRFLSMIHG